MESTYRLSDLTFCLSNKFPDAADAVGLWTTFPEQRVKSFVMGGWQETEDSLVHACKLQGSSSAQWRL